MTQRESGSSPASGRAWRCGNLSKKVLDDCKWVPNSGFNNGLMSDTACRAQRTDGQLPVVRQSGDRCWLHLPPPHPKHRRRARFPHSLMTRPGARISRFCNIVCFVIEEFSSSHRVIDRQQEEGNGPLDLQHGPALLCGRLNGVNTGLLAPRLAYSLSSIRGASGGRDTRNRRLDTFVPKSIGCHRVRNPFQSLSGSMLR